MANGINIVVIEGNLVKDPELRYSPAGLAILEGAVANNREYKKRDANEEVKETCFVDFVCFGTQAEFYAEHLSKGSPVVIHARLKQDRWEASDGTKRSKHKLNVDRIALQFPVKNSQGGNGTSQTSQAPESNANADDGVPF